MRRRSSRTATGDQLSVARYTKQSWVDGSGGGTPVSAARLGAIETGLFNADYRAAARAFHNAAQSIANNTTTVLALNSERFDQEANVASTIHDTVTNNSRLTCRTAGVYAISAAIEWAANSTGIRTLNIRLNGATVLASVDLNTTTGGGAKQTAATHYALAVNDYVEITVLQNSGGALNVNSTGNYSPEFSMVLVA